ncbi:hypothetical protein H4R18_003616 [Coemansia javaensis]|uniref:Uncharacterized protein n=1 Tax=Coemansia javaensis TaxID=2761396 RepID=A0A9W8H877_9FUNG|nr:hypothetical protein H4R18_003616 [Coemansia javaensis]
MAPDRREAPSSRTLQRQRRAPTEVEQAVFRTAETAAPALALSALNLAALARARKAARGYPSVMQCTWYAGIFAASAYALSTGDTVNGPGLAAGWSAIWLFFNGRKALRSRSPAPIAMAAAVAAIGSMYGYSFLNLGRQ